ncbi:MAG: 3-phosphoglycerate dehydrogenase family protein [Spirochaetota bacterium]
MKVLISDALPETTLDKIKNLGAEVTYDPQLKEQSLLEELKKESYEILVVRSTVVTGEMIHSSPALSLIIRAGSGYNTIDVATASERSVYVANCPGKNSIAVAELAFGLMLSMDRRIPDNVIQLREGRWNKKEFSKARGIYGKTLGIIGLGRIGKLMIPRAKAFGLNVIGWSRSLTEQKAEEWDIKHAPDPPTVADEADIITVHLTATPDTQGFINAEFFNAMKEGAYFINTSRSEIVDQKALMEAMDKKGIRAGIDVFAAEPSSKTGDFQDDIAKNKNLYGTHHIGASTEQAQNAVADETVRIVQEYLNTGHVPNCVNIMDRPPAKAMLTIHHRNRIGVLAGVLDIIRDARINVERMENIIFEKAQGACAQVQLDDSLSKQDLTRIEGLSEDIFFVKQVELS